MNNYGGGGFMTEASPGFSASQPSQASKKKNDTVVPCTVAILRKAQYDQQLDTFVYEGVEIFQVRFIGIIQEVEEATTCITYKISDMTGPSIMVKRWTYGDEQELEDERRSQCRENTYVRVYGNLKFFQDTPSILSFSIVPVTDFNEITFHMLDVVYTFRLLTKSSPSNAQKSLNFKSGQNGSFTPVNDGIGGVERQILNSVNACTLDQGISTTELKQKFSKLGENQIRKALDFLCNEGHIYSTIDEDHFKSTSE